MMKNIKVYLDNCCYNRPFDDQASIVVYLETLAKLQVQKMIQHGELDLVWSYMLDFENAANTYVEKRERIAEWKRLSAIDVELSDDIVLCAKKFMLLGLRHKDASHIACAIAANADCFITTDKKILNKPIQNISVLNPIDFIRRYVDVPKQYE